MHWFIETLSKFNRNTAFIYKGNSVGYDELKLLISRCDGWLKNEKITPGAVVLLQGDYAPYTVAMLLALLENKNIIIPVVTQLTEDVRQKIDLTNAAWLIKMSDAKPIFSELDTNNVDSPLIDRLKKNKCPGLILFSSGSTGKSKAMVHDLNKLLETYRNKSEKKLNILIFMGFDHIGGLDTLFRALSIGGTITIATDRSPRNICSLIEKYKVNILPVTPTFLNLLLLDESYKNYDFSSLKIIGFGAEPMPTFLLKKVRTIFPDIELQQKFGTSETNAIRIKNRAPDSLFFKIDDPHAAYKIVDNELWLKSTSQILGYLDASTPALDEEGWFRTGDLVETADDGSIKIVGRIKGVINVGGEKVLPEEVEALLMGMDEISDALVYGEANPLTGQIVVADIIPARQTKVTDIKKCIRTYCKNKLESYKIPVKVFLVDKLDYGKRMKKRRYK